MECKYKERSHYGVCMDILVCMAATRSSTYSILLQYPTLNALLYYGIVFNAIGMEPLHFLAAQFLTWLQLGLGILYASTLD
jgi:hypothetical protein